MRKITEYRLFMKLVLSLLIASAPHSVAHARDFKPVSKLQSALRQGQSAQQTGNFKKAINLYCAAASSGNPEGYFRIGRLLAIGPSSVRSPSLANSYLAMAMRLGNQEASRYFNPKVANAPMSDTCGTEIKIQPTPSRPHGGHYSPMPGGPFNVDAYLARQPPAKQKVATMLRQTAKRHKIDARLVLAIAIAESNLNSEAVSPRNAQGVMQLIPETQERFGVTEPFNPEQNIKGGVSYLKWLHKRFDGNWELISAAYNAGENAVARYGGIPPYDETQEYVKRVLYFAGVN